MPRLRRSDPSRPGIARRRRGRGFSYAGPDGAPVKDPETMLRIKALVIPPAWRDVWICPWPHGHIQAVGYDAAGRRQYLYDEAWRKRRDAEKFERVVDFGRLLPALRAAVSRDITSSGVGKRRVLATAVRLIDLGCFRVGGEEYAEEHETFGVATLRKEHVSERGGKLVFRYPAKGSIPRTVVIDDKDVTAVVRSLRHRRDGGEELLAWKEGRGKWVDVRAADINEYIKEEMGDHFSAKDFRTWSATVYAAVTLAGQPHATRSTRARARTVVAAVKDVAEYLGNTPTVCRSSYIDPRILDRYDSGETIEAVAEVAIDLLDSTARGRVENAVIGLLSDTP